MIGMLIGVFFLSGFPSNVFLDKLEDYLTDKNIVDSLYHAMRDPNVIDRGMSGLMDAKTPQANAGNFQIQTGYYIGNGGAKQISGLGFSPQMILIKANDTGGTGAIMKTTVMPNLNSSYLGVATADVAAAVLLNPDGFTISGVTTNTANSRYTWTAFAGSDCSASGNFCVGTYTGTGTSPRSVTVGFQPDMVIVKAATAVAPNWRSSAMPTNYGQHFMATNQTTDGTMYTTLDSTGFTVGSVNNTSATIYYYVAFKNTAGSINVGTYAGTGVAKNVTGVGFTPNFALTKAAAPTTATAAIYNNTESYGNSSSYFTDTVNVVGGITGLDSDGFGVGTGAMANISGATFYYAAFGGASAVRNSSGTFQIARGTYTGTGINRAIDNLGFRPDLVIIKGNTATAGVFRTRLMGGDHSAYLDAATANLTAAITSLNPDGFTVGTGATTNSAGVTYYWTAYGNAWNPETNSGSSDFYIGAYYGNGIDNRNVIRLPFQADMVATKRNSTTGGAFRTSAHSGDLSSFFAATAEAANNIQVLNPDGFQIGTGTNVNAAASLYHYFGFKSGANFAVGTYSGTGAAKDVTTVGFQPDNVWVKQTGAVRGVSRHSNQSGDAALPFINVASITGAFTGLISTGFSIGAGAETNTLGTNNYRYAAWRLPDIANISIAAYGSQIASLGIPSAGQYLGGAFTFIRSGGSANITSLTLSENGTVNASSYISELTLKYEIADTCNYDGTEATFGNTASFASEKATVSGNMPVGSAQVCLYPIITVGTGVDNGSTLDLSIDSLSDILISSGSGSGSFPVNISGLTNLISGSLTVDIVDSDGSTIANPSLAMDPINFAFISQTASGTLGVSSKKIRIDNNSGNAQWTLSIAATGGNTSVWSGAGNTYDFNDISAGGNDGADLDSYGGQMNFNPGIAVITPESGCETTGLTLGSPSSFAEGVLDSVNILSANSSAQTGCYWDLTGIGISQTIPAEQVTDNYSINMTLTITAI